MKMDTRAARIACIVALVAPAAIFYLLGAFAAADFNIAHWDAFGRLAAACCMLFGTIVLLVILADLPS